MRHILVIEDEPEIRKMIQVALEESGDYRVIAAQALDEVEARVEADRPDLIILDAVVPSAAGFPGRSGMEFAAYALARDVPVIVMTGHADLADTLEEARFPLLRKPFSIGHLRRAVRGATLRPKDNLRQLRDALAHLLHHREAFAALLEELGRLSEELDAGPGGVRSPRAN